MTPIIQAEASECGLTALAIASRILGAHYSLSELRHMFPTSGRGQNLNEIMAVATSIGLNTRAVRCDINEVADLTLPAILHWEFNHFVVLTKTNDHRFELEDPAVGRRVIGRPELSRCFTGVALEVGKSRAFQKRKSRPAITVGSVLPWTRPIWMGLSQALLLSLIVQAFVLAAPFYMQLAIDEAALRGDLDLLNVIAIGFGLFAIVNVGATFLRNVVAQRVAALMGWAMTVRLYTHLLRLPLRWFQKRRLADTLIRFESIEPIRTLVANGLASGIVDALVVISTLVMMFVFSWTLAAVALVAAMIFLIIRVTTIPLSLRFASQELTSTIAEQGKRIETLKAIQTIKAMGGEAERERDWSLRYADVVKTSQANGVSRFAINSFQELFEAIAYVLIIFLAVRQVVAAEMTVGAVFAFVAYRAQFQQRAASLIETMVNWRMLDLHTNRLSDIVLEPQERLTGTGVSGRQISGNVELDNLSFRYSNNDPVIFQGLTLGIHAGEFVAVVGPSGSGKSTLMKVIAGLYDSGGGQVLLDGMPLDAWGASRVRRSIGMVLQDDELLTGSIIDNVTFFDDQKDAAWAWDCLKLASIAEEVSRMPMGIETLVGDMGSSLSGGQKQRILLARALYRRPKILLLDEATSHLDLANERSISSAIAGLSVTRIVSAHRRETIAMADKIVAFEGGRVTVYNRSQASEAPQAVPAQA